MKKILVVLALFLCISQINAQKAETFKVYKLKNGLSVILDRDSTQNQVFGMVAVNVGSKDEELNATGLAHYLEHMLFKGTQTLGTSDWEKEKPLIDKTYELYDKLQDAKSDEEIAKINKEINDVSQKASQYAIPNELSKLVDQMGGLGFNASTSYDATEYHNLFPPNQLEKWLDLYAHRFQKPVFRLFQTELEAVYEEKNRAEDNTYHAFQNAFMKSCFETHPYGRPIIGYTEHLKKPWMSKMRDFFEKWYVPQNMALILSGNFDIANAEKLINEKFGKWEAKSLPERKDLNLKPFDSKKTVKVKLTPMLMAERVYRIPRQDSKTELALDIASGLLSNSAQTGLLDKLSLEGDVLFANAGNEVFKDGGIFTISFAPVFDVNQRRQLSFGSAENLIEKELNKLKQKQYADWLFEQVKSNLLKEYKLMMEHPQGRVFALMRLFIQSKPVDDLFKFPDALAKMTKDEVSEIVSKYIGDNYLSFYSQKGEGKKEKIKKPDIDPIKPTKHGESEYAKHFMQLPSTDVEKMPFVNMRKDVVNSLFADKVMLHYVKNKRNDVFSMNIIFRVGTGKIPMLKYAVELLNNAGVMGAYKPDELRKEFGKLGVTYEFSASKDYTTINMKGSEKVLGKACQLITKLMLLPQIEEKALNRIVGMEYQNRMIGKDMPAQQFDALREYIRYGKESEYLNRISLEDLVSVSPSKLTGELNKAFSYSADIHYYGKLPLGDLYKTLKENLAFASNRLAGTSPDYKAQKDYDENTIFLVNNKKSTQSKIFVYVKSDPVSIDTIPVVQAFNQYFGGGFTGLMMKEIREFRSLAYSAGAHIRLPKLTQWNTSLLGVIGTQADKTVEAVEVVSNLLVNMPEYPERMKNIKDYLFNSSFMIRPADRYLSYNVYSWRLKGYKQDPVQYNLPIYEKMTFDDLVSFYKKNLKGKKYVMGIVGPTKSIDTKKLAKYGKVVKLSSSKIFSSEK